MKIEVYKPGIAPPEAKVGNFFCIYGKSKSGKSASCLATAEDPILWMIMERAGQVELTMKAIKRPELRLKVAYYESWDDTLEYVNDLRNFKGIHTLLFDGLTHVMNVHLSDEIMDENYESKDKDKIDKEMTARVKMSPESYGVMSKQMLRLMKAFERLTVQGIDVICTARDQEQPKWDRSLSCAPALAGKEFPRDFKGFFDFIGYIESRFDEKGNVVYPPYVSFDDDGSYLSGWTGIKPEGGVIKMQLDIKRIIEIAHGIQTK